MRKKLAGLRRERKSASVELRALRTVTRPEKVVRYSAMKGYTLAFKRGTNVTMNPARLDKKSSVLLKNLMFVQQGGNWQPTAGVITYQFLGQKGTASVLDFVTP